MLRMRGFTLIELVTVILILSVVSVGISGFIGSGTQIFVDVTERDQVLSDSRFVVERINRELTSAVPNSIRLSGDNTVHCLEFVPTLWSSFYLDIPTPPESATDTIEVAALEGLTDAYDTSSANDHFVVVYPSNAAQIYLAATDTGTYLQGQRIGLSSVSTTEPISTLTLDDNARFLRDSPLSRLYIVGQPVSYCAYANGEIRRHSSYGFLIAQSVNSANIGSGVLMAEHLGNSLSALPGSSSNDPFRITNATLTRNASVLTRLRFERNDELVEFRHEVHIANVP